MEAVGSLRIIFHFSQLLGFLPFSLNKSKDGFVFTKSVSLCTYTTIIFSVSIILEICMVWHHFCMNVYNSTKNAAMVVSMISTISIPVSTLILFLVVQCKRDKYYFWLRKTNELFSNLEDGHLRRIKRMYLQSFLFMKGMAIVLVTYEIYNFETTFEPTKKSILFSNSSKILLFVYYILIGNFKMFIQLFVVFLNLFRYYYKEKNRFLNPLNDWRKTDRKFWLFYLRGLRAQDLDVKDFLDFLHEFFVPVLSLELFWSFATTLADMALASKLGVPRALHLMWVLYTYWDIFLVAGLCHEAEVEGEKMMHNLHRLFIYWDDKELKKEIDIFSLQIQHRKVEFSALGFHRMNLTLLYSTFGSLASYAVILVQFQNEPNEGGNYLHKIISNSSMSIN